MNRHSIKNASFIYLSARGEALFPGEAGPASVSGTKGPWLGQGYIGG